jgi:monofunctional biosynthetic peptidoglycan transglycosylase
MTKPKNFSKQRSVRGKIDNIRIKGWSRFGRLLPRRFGSWIALSAFLSVVLGSLVVSLFIQGYQAEFTPVEVLKSKYPVVIYRGRGRPFEMTWRSQRPPHWTSLGSISRVALGAVIVSEDWSFYSHKGYDAAAIREAIIEDLEARKFVRGASTLTQQVAKNVFLERDKTLWRKLKEFWLALELEEKVGKRRILETYFNIAEWGEGIFGIQAASRHYFQKSPAALLPREAAFLAMLLPSPKKYSVSFRQRALTRYARRTVSSILLKMWKGGYLTEVEYQEALHSRMGFEAPVPTTEVVADSAEEMEGDSDADIEANSEAEADAQEDGHRGSMGFEER